MLIRLRLAAALPVFHGGFGEAFGGRAAGVGNADIQPAVFASDVGDELAHLLVAGHVQGAGQHVDAGLAADLFGRLGRG